MVKPAVSPALGLTLVSRHLVQWCSQLGNLCKEAAVLFLAMHSQTSKHNRSCHVALKCQPKFGGTSTTWSYWALKDPSCLHCSVQLSVSVPPSLPHRAVSGGLEHPALPPMQGVPAPHGLGRGKLSVSVLSLWMGGWGKELYLKYRLLKEMPLRVCRQNNSEQPLLGLK